MKIPAFDVAIIGAGVVGAAIARQLAGYQLKVAVLEKNADISFGVSKANSGIIHAGFHHKTSTLKARLEIRGNRMYDRLQAELNFPFKRVGILVAAFSGEEMKTVESLYHQGLANGLTDLQIIGHARILELEPKLNHDVTGGLYAPGGGIIEPYRFVFALMECAVAGGVQLFRDFRVTEAVFSEGSYYLRSAGGSRIAACRVINAAGLYADEVSRLCGGEDFAIIPRKGEEFLLERGAAGFPNHVIFPVPSANSKGVLVIPTVEGTMMIGPTAVEVKSKEDFSTTGENLDKVFSLAMQMVPSISRQSIITAFAGLRPVLAGDDFLIKVSEKAPNLIQVAGIQSPGLTAAPAIAEMVCELLAGCGVNLLPDRNFNPNLAPGQVVRQMPQQAAAALVKQQPAYGNIVCRCEMVSEGEIIEAIRAGHTTLDGIKFYARTGMGRCQGAFCSYKIIKLIRKLSGLPLTEITKRGGQSRIITGTLDKTKVE